MLEKGTAWYNDVIDALAFWVWPLSIAGLARLLWYAQQIRSGRVRLAFSLIAFELGMAVLCAIIGVGLAQYFGLVTRAQQGAVIGIFAWFGMNGIQSLIVLWLRRNGVPMPTVTIAPPPASPDKH